MYLEVFFQNALKFLSFFQIELKEIILSKSVNQFKKLLDNFCRKEKPTRKNKTINLSRSQMQLGKRSPDSVTTLACWSHYPHFSQIFVSVNIKTRNNSSHKESYTSGNQLGLVHVLNSFIKLGPYDYL
jgi:hypothetical protein